MRARANLSGAARATAAIALLAALSAAPACVAVRQWDGTTSAALQPCDAKATATGVACIPSHARSCVELPATCGAGESCCTSILLPGGKYSRGYDPSGVKEMLGPDGKTHGISGFQPAQTEAIAATMLPFYLDKYEVSVGRFRKFLAAYDAWVVDQPKDGSGTNEYWPGTGWRQGDWKNKLPTKATELVARFDPASGSTCGQTTWHATAAGDATENLPISCVDWYEAFAFCIWDGGRLPTEAEWNYAAAGGDKQRAFPWSDPPADLSVADGYANVQLVTESDYALVGATKGHDARWGHADLAGNVWEWVLDYAPASLASYYAQTPCTHCADATYDATNDFRVMRGGSKRYGSFAARTAFRLGPGAAQKYGDMGFRCARAQASP